MSKLRFEPVTPDRWPDFEHLFGQKGACGGCWCMYWRQSQKEYDRHKGADNKRRMKKLIAAGEVPGILGYEGNEPVAWCAVQPREQFPRLGRSPTLKPIDDTPVWSVVCFYIAKPYRRQGVSVKILKAAVKYVKQQGGRMVEGYPYEPGSEKWPDAFAWSGTTAAFKRAGFKEVARPSRTRAIMRKKV